ncbi:MAG TPA: oligosaccharyl transferase, archaeosortase A system-associated [Methanothrix sp.]|jgi:oligosaccharyl transferase (archaeosortase A-associated)|nr:oligosaccharyl transferase, archaeosortase A system-associated [Methanothrix sp.]
MDQGRKRSEPAELAAVLVLGLLLRLFAGRASLTEKGILLPGYDEYYHMRRILFTALHFPNTLWFDSYLNYPYGLQITWPPLFDQISAALCVALGQHSKPGIEMVACFAPLIFGLIAIAAVYYIVRELFDHKVALLAAFMAALAPYYLLYTMFAAMDHHCLEVLLLIIVLLFMIMAISRKERRYIYAVACGVAMALLAYTWQGADVYLAIFLLYAAVQMTLDLLEGKPSRETATILLAAYAVAFILVLPFGSTVWLSASFYGIGAMIVALCIMFALAHIMSRRRISWKAFPLSILMISALFALVSELAGGFFAVGGLIQSGTEYIWGGEMIGKIGEAEPLIYDAYTFSQVVFSMLGCNLLFSLGGIVASIIFIRRSVGLKRPGQILLLIWTVSTLILTLGQSRFLYVSTIAMGILVSILFFRLLEVVNGRHQDAKPATSAGKSRLLAGILFLLLVLPTAWDAASFAGNSPPAVAGDWADSLAWLKENSNTTSFFESPEKVAEYSVMSWWDYGNWVLYLAERPVVANNFQSGVADAAKFYLSDNEEEATAVLDARRSRYILVDNEMIYGKLSALTAWANEDLNTYIKRADYGPEFIAVPTEKLYNTTLGKLYLFDGAGTGHFRLVYESKTFTGSNPAKSEVKIFEYVPGALIKVKTGPDQKVGALLNMTSNQRREFVYLNEGQAKGDSFEIRVPYSTEGRMGCHATGPYLIYSGNEAGAKMKNIDVSEDDVRSGRTIELAF